MNDTKSNEAIKIRNSNPSITTEKRNLNQKVLTNSFDKSLLKLSNLNENTNIKNNLFGENIDENIRTNENLCKHCYQISQINKRKLCYKQSNGGLTRPQSSSSSSSLSSVVTYANIEKIRKKTNHSQNNLNNVSRSHNHVKENDYTEIDVNASKALFDASRAHQLARIEHN